MSDFLSQNQCDDFTNEPTAADWQEFAEWAEMEEAQRETFFEGVFEEGHTDVAYDSWKNSQVFGGIFLD